MHRRSASAQAFRSERTPASLSRCSAPPKGSILVLENVKRPRRGRVRSRASPRRMGARGLVLLCHKFRCPFVAPDNVRASWQERPPSPLHRCNRVRNVGGNGGSSKLMIFAKANRGCTGSNS
jgi:hypothetical protein